MDTFTIASIAMQDDLQRLNHISHNLANVATTGYKRQVEAGQPFASFLQTDPVWAAAQTADNGVNAASFIDMHGGSLRATNQPLDLTLEGEGFFEVTTPNGPAYARSGSMHIDARGRLVTQDGLPLAGIHGDVRPNAGALSINAQGEVRQDNRLLGELRLVRFDGANRMQALGQGLYGQGLATLADPGKSPGVVRTGFLENSNVNSAQEMVRLTETVRHFEAMQKVMQGYGDVFDQTLRKLGEF